jgi:hypothetical protein
LATLAMALAAYPHHRRRGRDQGGQWFRAPLRGTYRSGMGTSQSDSRRGAQNTFHCVRDHEDRKGVRRWPGKRAEGSGRRPACARLAFLQRDSQFVARQSAERLCVAPGPGRWMNSVTTLAAVNARALIEPPTPQAQRISWVGPRTRSGTPASIDVWPCLRSNAPIIRARTRSRWERKRDVPATNMCLDVRRISTHKPGGATQCCEDSLEVSYFAWVGGVFLLTSIFIDGAKSTAPPGTRRPAGSCSPVAQGPTVP